MGGKQHNDHEITTQWLQRACEPYTRDEIHIENGTPVTHRGGQSGRMRDTAERHSGQTNRRDNSIERRDIAQITTDSDTRAPDASSALPICASAESFMSHNTSGPRD